MREQKKTHNGAISIFATPVQYCMNCTLRTKAYAPKKKKRGGAQENHRLMGALRWVKGARREGILAGADSPATHRTAAAPGRGGPLPANACGVAALTAAADAARSLTAALTAEVLQQVSKAKGACIPPPPTITEGSGRGQVHRSSSGGQRTAHEETRQRQSQHRASAHSAKRPSSTTLRQALNGHGGHPRPPAPPPPPLPWPPHRPPNKTYHWCPSPLCSSTGTRHCRIVPRCTATPRRQAASQWASPG